MLVSVHGFTPVLRRRPPPLVSWGARQRDAASRAHSLQAFATRNADVGIALNEPYTVDDMSDYTIPVHGERRRLACPPRSPQRPDRRSRVQGRGALWAQLLADALTVMLQTIWKEVTNVDWHSPYPRNCRRPQVSALLFIDGVPGCREACSPVMPSSKDVSDADMAGKYGYATIA